MVQPAAPRRGNPVGIASVVFGILMLLASIAELIVVPLLPLALLETSFPYRSVPYLLSLPAAFFATSATVLGIVGLLLRDRARVPAVIGTTLGASHLIVNLPAMYGAGLAEPALG